jgi:hypothetical protein
MRDIGEPDADSGKPVGESPGFSRGTALKVGGIGLASALAAFMPGRAGAAVKRHTANASCAGTGFLCLGSNQAKLCGYDTGPLGSCFCGELYYGKIRPRGAPVGACVENFFCDDFNLAATCTRQRDCGPGYACITGTCCNVIVKGQLFTNFCLPYCQQGSQNQAQPLRTPKTTAHR